MGPSNPKEIYKLLNGLMDNNCIPIQYGGDAKMND